jgi:hypothetical protein
VHCLDDDVDSDVFFPEDIDADRFLDSLESSEDMDSEEAQTRWAAWYAPIVQLNEERTRQAKAICAGCPFSLECLTNSITQGNSRGTWGGLGETERRLMINRFGTLRREYQNGSMPAAMRRDIEGHARQIAGSLNAATADQVRSESHSRVAA